MRHFIAVLIFLCTATNIDQDRAFLEIMPDIRYKNYYSWHDFHNTKRCGFQPPNYYSVKLWNLGRIQMSEVSHYSDKVRTMKDLEV